MQGHQLTRCDLKTDAIYSPYLLALAVLVLDDPFELEHVQHGPRSWRGSQSAHALAENPAGARRGTTEASLGLRLPFSSPSPNDSARSAPERPVASAVLVRTAMPSSASERSSKRIPSRARRSTPTVGSSITSRLGWWESA